VTEFFLSAMLAASTIMLSSVVVLTNSLRLRRFNPTTNT